jgi:hypothetical protein
MSYYYHELEKVQFQNEYQGINTAVFKYLLAQMPQKKKRLDETEDS